MFETTSLEARPKQTHSYKALPASLVIHGVVAAAAVLGALGNVTFPDQSPRMLASYNLVELPPPPPPPPPPPAAAKVQLVKSRPEPPPAPPEEVAPSVIPDEIIPAAPTSVVQQVFGSGTGPVGVEGGIDGGIDGGVVGGVPEGVAGGDVGGTDGGTMGGVVVVGRDKPLRMFPLSQVYPIYPENARIRLWEDRLVVRYVIGTNGRVKQVTILEPAERKVFDEATLDAIRHWRFRPLMKDGQAQEVIHELTIYYKLRT